MNKDKKKSEVTTRNLNNFGQKTNSNNTLVYSESDYANSHHNRQQQKMVHDIIDCYIDKYDLPKLNKNLIGKPPLYPGIANPLHNDKSDLNKIPDLRYSKLMNHKIDEVYYVEEDFEDHKESLNFQKTQKNDILN